MIESRPGERRPNWAMMAPCMAALVMAAQAQAATPPKSAPAASVQAVLACRPITDDTQRLACFDKATATMDEAEAKGDLLTLDREQRRAVRRQAFGLTMPSFAVFDRGEKPEEANKLMAKVASASHDAYGKWTIRLADGAVWAQIDDNELPRAPHEGSDVVITKGALGSFFMKVDGQQAVRARRQS